MKVTCICPTANRPEYLAKCIKCFLFQDYKDKELIILDDGKEPSDKYAEDYSGLIRYIYRGPKRRSIGAKLNALIDECNSDIICRFDDDDWYANNRISEQVALMESSGAKFVGYHTFIYYDERYNITYRFYNSKRTCSGSSFMFNVNVWCESKFEEICVTGSDNLFLIEHQSKLVTSDGSQSMVARLHHKASNIEVKTPDYFKKHWQYKQVDKSEIPLEFWVNQNSDKLDCVV